MNISFASRAVRHGAILATLAAIPILVGYAWNAVWQEGEGVTWGNVAALLFAWMAAAGVVAALSYNSVAQNDGGAARWFFKCHNCGNGIAIFSIRCSACETPVEFPSNALAFRKALLYGTGIFYAFYTFGWFILRF